SSRPSRARATGSSTWRTWRTTTSRASRRRSRRCARRPWRGTRRRSARWPRSRRGWTPRWRRWRRLSVARARGPRRGRTSTAGSASRRGAGPRGEAPPRGGASACASGSGARPRSTAAAGRAGRGDTAPTSSGRPSRGRWAWERFRWRERGHSAGPTGTTPARLPLEALAAAPALAGLEVLLLDLAAGVALREGARSPFGRPAVAARGLFVGVRHEERVRRPGAIRVVAGTWMRVGQAGGVGLDDRPLRVRPGKGHLLPRAVAHVADGEEARQHAPRGVQGLAVCAGAHEPFGVHRRAEPHGERVVHLVPARVEERVVEPLLAPVAQFDDEDALLVPQRGDLLRRQARHGRAEVAREVVRDLARLIAPAHHRDALPLQAPALAEDAVAHLAAAHVGGEHAVARLVEAVDARLAVHDARREHQRASVRVALRARGVAQAHAEPLLVADRVHGLRALRHVHEPAAAQARELVQVAPARAQQIGPRDARREGHVRDGLRLGDAGELRALVHEERRVLEDSRLERGVDARRPPAHDDDVIAHGRRQGPAPGLWVLARAPGALRPRLLAHRRDAPAAPDVGGGLVGEEDGDGGGEAQEAVDDAPPRLVVEPRDGGGPRGAEPGEEGDRDEADAVALRAALHAEVEAEVAQGAQEDGPQEEREEGGGDDGRRVGLRVELI